MRLSPKLNVVLFLLLVGSWIAAAVLAKRALLESAREEAIQQVKIVMAGARVARNYTFDEIKPLLEESSKVDFHPQILPAYASMHYGIILEKTLPDVRYREASRNPSNPFNRAAGWELNVIKRFEEQEKLAEYIGEETSPSGQVLAFSRPVRAETRCLSCHGDPKEAPAAMLKKYGSENGFHYKPDDIMAVQIASVSMSAPVEKANKTWKIFSASLGALFGILFLTLNVVGTSKPPV